MSAAHLKAVPTAVAPTVVEPAGTAPRQPTRDENRKIQARLDEIYDVERKCYTAGHNDKTVAAALKMPWAWVSGIREMLFGPEGNEEIYLAMEAFEALRNELPAAIRAIKLRTDNEISTVREATERQINVVIDNRDRAIEKLNARMTELEVTHRRVIASAR